MADCQGVLELGLALLNVVQTLALAVMADRSRRVRASVVPDRRQTRSDVDVDRPPASEADPDGAGR